LKAEPGFESEPAFESEPGLKSDTMRLLGFRRTKAVSVSSCPLDDRRSTRGNVLSATPILAEGTGSRPGLRFVWSTSVKECV
jgi:hypothetical protein